MILKIVKEKAEEILIILLMVLASEEQEETTVNGKNLNISWPTWEHHPRRGKRTVSVNSRIREAQEEIQLQG